MAVDGVTPVLNVSDIAQSFAFFELFDWERSFTWNQEGLIGDGPEAATENEHGKAGFGGVRQGKTTIFLCVDCQGSKGTRMPSCPGADDTDGVWMTWWVTSRSEVDRYHEIAVENGCVVTWPPTDEPWGVREFHLRHPDGHMFRVSCGLGE
ncbi:MAG: VOC family protein [Rhodothermales bacterium]|nr:VOC family protein [Rhodothermales bacterium]MBO6779211.1 VOC family protein [Rhodothermales bacterium]